jgi:hypothetical protein
VYKTNFMDKYPVVTYEYLKSDITFKTVTEIINYFQQKIENHKIAALIGTFNHFEHTKKIAGEINPDILDAQLITFCFGPKLPNSKVMALKPRTIGVCEFENKFVIEMMEAPNEQMQKIMEEWVSSINTNLKN